MHGILPNEVKITIYHKQQLRNNTVLSHALFRNAHLHSNVMLRFMVQALRYVAAPYIRDWQERSEKICESASEAIS